MSEPDNFLSRWSRRKIEAERDEKPTTERDGALRSSEQPQSVRRRENDDPAADQTAESAALDSHVGENERKKDLASTGPNTGETGKETEFDLSSLPSIDSISAVTDVRVFLQKGVPAELTRAALRRAWTADPAIRDFIGIAENQYDFATGSDIPGFGSLDVPVEEIRKLVAEAFGEAPQRLPGAEPPAEKLPQNEPAQPSGNPSPAAQSEEVAGTNKEQTAAVEPAQGDAENIVQRDKEYAAVHQNIAEQQSEPAPLRRTHGRALPQ